MTRAPTSSRKVWWLDNGGSQSPQWGVWITKPSPVRCRWSRSCHSMDSILPVQNKDFTRDGKEFTKVPWAVAKAESYYSDNSLAFIKSGAELNCERWNFCSIATITTGWKMGGWFCGMLLPSAKCNGWVSSDFSSIKTSSVWQESITWYLSWVWIDRGEKFGKERFWFRIWKIWKSWTHQKLILEESTRKKYWHHKREMDSYSQ